MRNSKVIIKSVPSTDTKQITKVQQLINQWITNGLLRKYEMHTCNDNVIFNICRYKTEAELAKVSS